MSLPRPALLLAVCALSGCATYTDAELAQLRQSGLRPDVYQKLERRRPLAPDDLIALRRAGIRDALVERQLDDVGIDYLVTRPDVLRLKKAGVSATVIDELLRESDRFAGRHTGPEYDAYYGYGYPYASPIYGDLSFGVGYGF